MIRIRDDLAIPLHEVSFETSTSSGPGGQHVNRSQTRVTLLFDVEASQTLSGAQKQRIHRNLSGRIDRRGRLRVRCGRHRSQAANREETIRRFAEVIAAALRRRRRRVATRPSAAERRRRVDDKRRRSKLKQQRRRPDRDD